MTQRFTEGFATYGQAVNFNATSPVALAMLSGRWASLNNLASYTIGQLPWAPTDTDFYFSCQELNAGQQGARVVLPVSATTCIVSLYFAVNNLPTATPAVIAHFCDSTNTIICGLAVTTTGALELYNVPSGITVIASSAGPVLTAQSAAHVEFQLVQNGSSSTFTCQVNGVAVITATGLTLTNSNAVAQLRFLDALPQVSGDGTLAYIGNLIIRDGAGSYNNGIVGDRRVATLFVDANDTVQGWPAFPLQLFGPGILNNTATNGNNTSVTSVPAATTDIGSSQYTIEGWFRLQALPTSTSKAVLFSKWDAPNNHASFELYIGGPNLENGNTVFRVSTDGTSATVVEVISWAVQWQVGVWYHVAVARDASNNTRLFVDGQMQGLPIADARTYYSGGASGASPCLGAECSTGSGIVANTSFNGWQDEFRLTIGYCRYTAAFTPPVAAFPRGSGDAEWTYVAWISGWDVGIIDESSRALALTAQNGAAALQPGDGAYAYQVLDKPAGPNDNTFIQAIFASASDVLTYTALPTVNDVIRVGTKDGSAAANYTWVTSLTAAFQVLIGASIAASMGNLLAAIIAGPGAGTLYGSGTTANHDVSGTVLPNGQLFVVALSAGAAGNSIAATSTDPNGTWATATLTGGVSIPGDSQFLYQRLPSNTSIVDSVQILTRSWKTDSGSCVVQASFVGGGGGVGNGAANSVATAPTFYGDMFETDPDTSGALTPTTVLNGKIRINRTS